MKCCERQRWLLIQSGRGGGESESAYVCAECGQFQIHAERDGAHFEMSFWLGSSATLLAASQGYRRLREGESAERLTKRVFKPFDFGHLRLYKVVLSWETKDGKQGREHFVVAADSPNQTPQSAANLIRKSHGEAYDGNPNISHWHVHGYPLNVLQPVEWTENGVVLLNEMAVEAAAHFAHCRTCGEVSVSHCDEGGREYAIGLGLYVPDAEPSTVE